MSRLIESLALSSVCLCWWAAMAETLLPVTLLLLFVAVMLLEVPIPALMVFQPSWPSVLPVAFAQRRVVPLDECALLPGTAPPRDGAAPLAADSLGILLRHSSLLVHVRA